MQAISQGAKNRRQAEPHLITEYVPSPPYDDKLPELMEAYAGQVVDGQTLLQQLRARHDQPISLLAKLLVTRRILSFKYRGQFYFPLFQFNRRDMSVIPAMEKVLFELSPIYNDEDALYWFSAPNTSLTGSAPMDTVRRDPAAVIDAARLDRFSITG